MATQTTCAGDDRYMYFITLKQPASSNSGRGVVIFTLLGTVLTVGYLATGSNFFRSRLSDFLFKDDRKQVAGRVLVNTTGKPLCSFAVLKDYLASTGASYLRGDGVWIRRGKAGKLDRFQPEVCRLKYGRWVPRQRLSQCLLQFNISFVAILGDSNALRLYKVLRKTLSVPSGVRHFHCDNFRYSDVITPAIPARRCKPVYLPLRRYLPPNYFRCTVKGINTRSGSLMVQYLPVTGEIVPLEQIINRTATGCVEKQTDRFVRTQATTIQEYILSEYLSTSPRPDLLLYFSSSWEQSSLSRYADTVNQFVSVLRRHTRKLTRTKLIVISRPDEFVPLKPARWKQVRYEGGKMSRNDWINASNHILHSRVSRLFVDGDFPEGPRVLLFPDIAAAMRAVMSDLAVDGVHSNDFWYSMLSSYILQTVCSVCM